MPVKRGAQIAPAKGKLGVLLVGLGAVSTTFIAGVEAIKEGLAEPIGSLTQMGTIRLGKRTDNRVPAIRDFVPLAGLDNLVFGGWDIFDSNCYEAAVTSGVLDRSLLEQVRPFLSEIQPMPAVFNHDYVKRIQGPNVKKAATHWDAAEMLAADIRAFQKRTGAERLVM